jgi:hypothetical protein
MPHHAFLRSNRVCTLLGGGRGFEAQAPKDNAVRTDPTFFMHASASATEREERLLVAECRKICE